MKRLLSIVLLAAALAQLSGCAQLTAMQSDVLTQIQAYESEQKFGAAFELVAAVSPDHAQYPRIMQKKAQLEAKARSFEQATSKRAHEMVAQNRWMEAQAIYEDALDKYPASQSLQADQREFQRRQEARVDELRTDQLVAKARWLERALPVQESIVATDADNGDSLSQLKTMRAEATAVATELSRIGLAALNKNNLGVAARTLPIAARLAPASDAEKAQTQLTQQEAEQDSALRASHDKALDRLRQQEGRKLFTDYEAAYRAGDLRRAALIMTRLKELDGSNPEIVRENTRLQAQLDTVIKKHMDEGNSLYSRGKFEEAKASWNRVLEIDPENEMALTSLDRANRVVDKLKQLRDKQPTESPAPAQ